MDKKTEIMQLLERAGQQKGMARARTLADALKALADPLTDEEWAIAERPLRPAPKRAVPAGFGGRGRTAEERREQVEKVAAAKEARAAEQKRLRELRKKVAATRDPQWPKLDFDLPDGFVQVIDPMQGSLYEKGKIAAVRLSDISIQKETERAVQVHYLVNNRYSPEKWEWLPKSQIITKGDRVVATKEWLAKKNGFPFKRVDVVGGN